MKRICLVVGIAALCGCGGRRVDLTPVVPIDSAPPSHRLASLQQVRDDPSPAQPAEVDPPTTTVEPEPTEAPRPSLSEAITNVNGQLEDVFFAYDHFDLSSEAVTALRRDAELLRAILHEFPQLQITVEGHCDERGSAEYNLGLGDRRATRAVTSLAQFGLPTANFAPVSYGKEAPQCAESSESCWSRNRRAHFVVRLNATN